MRRTAAAPSLLGLGLVLILLLASLAGAEAAEIAFPALTGRVVDGAGLLDAGTKSRLTALLQGHEDKTGDQVVVVTLPSLQGRSIEEFGVGLGRHWGIGQKGKNNGVLLIVAPKERKVRIEVGYGLEGKLTDAESRVIIDRFILPAFKQGHMAAGIEAGAKAIVAVLGGDKSVVTHKPAADQGPSGIFHIVSVFFILLVFGAVFNATTGRRYRSSRYGPWTSGGYWGGGGFGGGGGGFGGGGFGGGGGSFGGGGSSGGW